MENSMIRLLKANEIECRVSTVNEKGVSVLLYKDARVDQKILDEVFGPFGWRRTHQSIDGNLYCTVEIFDKENGIWVAKQDVGTTGYTEKEKSQASDSFKRACFNWGIGRELYSAPFIWVSAGKADIWKNKDRYVCNDRFSVSSIEYNSDREISGLIIRNDKGIVVYEMKAPKDKANRNDTANLQKEKQQKTTPLPQSSSDRKLNTTPAVQSPEDEQWQNTSVAQNSAAGRQQSAAVRTPTKGSITVTKLQMDGLKAELQRTGVSMEDVKDRYKIQNPERMPEELYRRVMTALSRTKSAGVA